MATARQRLAENQARLDLSISQGAQAEDWRELVPISRGGEEDVGAPSGPVLFERGTPLKNAAQVMAARMGIKTKRMWDAEESEREEELDYRERERESVGAAFDEARQFAKGGEEVARLDELQRQFVSAERMLDHPDQRISDRAVDQYMTTSTQIDDVLGQFTTRKYQQIDQAAMSLENDLKEMTKEATAIDGLIESRLVAKGEFINLVNEAGDNDATVRALAQNYIGQSLNHSHTAEAFAAMGSAAASVGSGLSAYGMGSKSVPLIIGGAATALLGGATDLIKFADSLSTDDLVGLAEEVNQFAIDFNTGRSEDLRGRVMPEMQAQREALNEYYAPIVRTGMLSGAPLPDLKYRPSGRPPPNGTTDEPSTLPYLGPAGAAVDIAKTALKLRPTDD
jgi:hypothetical protein